MKNPPIFFVQETSMPGQSLLVWNDVSSKRMKLDHSLQMPTEIAEWIKKCCNKQV
jgi:hypothetical protein